MGRSAAAAISVRRATQWLAAAGAPQRQPGLSTAFDQVSILIQAVIADMGIALVQRCLVSAEIASGAVAVPFDLPITLRRGYFLCAPQDRRPRPGLAAFRQWLISTAKADIARIAPGSGPHLAL